MDKGHLSDTILFNDFLDTVNLTNKVTFSTHLSQHIIDLMLVKNQPTIVMESNRGTCFKTIISFMQNYALHTQTKRKTSIL